jgi:hypothetical protein
MVKPKLSIDATDKIAGKSSMKNLLINIPSPRDQVTGKASVAEILQKSIGLPLQEQ